MVGPILPCLPRFEAQAILGVFSLYTAMSIDDDEILVNGERRRSTRPILCVFDSGLTGCVLSQSLADELQLLPYQAGGSPAGAAVTGRLRVDSLELSIRTERGRRLALVSSARSSGLFYAQAIPLNWFNDKETLKSRLPSAPIGMP